MAQRRAPTRAPATINPRATFNRGGGVAAPRGLFRDCVRIDAKVVAADHAMAEDLGQRLLNRLAVQRAFECGAAFDGGRFDAGETALFLQKLEQVKATIVEHVYPKNRVREFFPVEAGIDPGAETYVWYRYDRAGMAKMIANYADDLPRIEELGYKEVTVFENIGISWSYNVQEIAAAGFAGYQLDARRGRIAREAIEFKIEKVCAFGDADRNFKGVLNNANIPILNQGSTPEMYGGWGSGATPAQILGDLNTMAWAPWTASKQVHTPNAMLFGTNAFKIISTTPISDDQPSTSVLEAFRKMNPHIRSVDPWVQLDLADAEGNGERAMVYEKSPDNITLALPLDFKSLPPEQRNLAFVVNAYARIGGPIIYRPLSAVYVDGLLDSHT